MKINLNSLLHAVVLTAFAAPTLAVAQDELCPKAYTWFSCPLDNGKTVAICGSPSTDVDQPIFGADDNAWLQYRYGTSDTIELVYPDATGNRLWRRFMAGIDYGPGGTPGRINLSFINDGIRYLIQGNQVPFEGRMEYSLMVVDEAAVDTLAELRCTGQVSDAGFFAVARAVPCDPNDAVNATRGQECW